MSARDTGGPAFPFAVFIGGYAGIVTNKEVDMGGMTLRDYFAANALTGLLADSELQAMPSEFARRSYALADAMLEARNK